MSIALFDEIRIYYGSDKLITIFRDLVNNNSMEAVKSINQKSLQFPSLFALYPEVKNSGLENQLNTRNKYACDFISKGLYEEELDSERILSDNSEDNFNTIRWILESGYSSDGMGEEYDQIIDTSAIVLCRLYNDKSCLRIIEDLIFDRYRKGAYIYDLTWAFFESIGPQNLHTLANRLRSANPKDVELARRFLNFIPDMNSREEDSKKLYQSAIKWINSNLNFLFYTGTTNNQTTNPERYALSLEAKYLQKPANMVREGQSRTLKKEEAEYLDNFSKLEEETKILLSKCSDSLFRFNRNKWSKWLQSPIKKQIEVARRVVDLK